MIVDNTQQIRSMLNFEENDFYFLQVLKRRKDNPEMTRNMGVIKNFYIESREDYDKKIPYIIEICHKENGRAYFRLNKRNYDHLGLLLVKRALDYVMSGNPKALKNVFDSVAGEYHSDKDKTWVVDIDWVDFEEANRKPPAKLVQLLLVLQREANREPLAVFIPTKNGVHIITRPFNKKKFSDIYPNVDIHKDSPTILYMP